MGQIRVCGGTGAAVLETEKMMAYATPVRVGCAGWNVPKENSDEFPSEGSHLERYSARFPAVEINSSFRNHHMPRTYARWADTTPPGFRFAIKMHRDITHDTRLADPSRLGAFVLPVLELGVKLGPILIQLPPSLAFEEEVARRFMIELRDRFDGLAV